MEVQVPLLSIGIIFKNEIRCLERCLKSLQPLRDAAPCELVMADTGSEDGSREIAEKYSDILIDFPWINDFAAARNAVMDQCSGVWYFSIDADEWLEGNVSELVEFVQPDNSFDGVVANLMIRNYLTPEFDENFSDCIAYRLFRLSTGLRYEGAIHEWWPYQKSGNYSVHLLSQVMLHHDGYVNLYGLDGEAKRKRNLVAILAELERNPDDLGMLTHFLACGKEKPEYLDKLRRAMELTRNQHLGWKELGPSIFRYAVLIANERDMSELKEWIQEAKERFPESVFTKVDVGFIDFTRVWDEKDYARCISVGEQCLKAIDDLNAGRIGQNELRYGTVLMQGTHWEQELKISLAESYLREKQPQRCREYLELAAFKYLDQPQTRQMIRTMLALHSQSDEDTTELVAKAWAEIQEPVPSKRRAAERRIGFLHEASAAFRNIEPEEGRPGYTLFLPLVGTCEAGNAAQILTSTDFVVLEQLLSKVEDWNELPIQALAHALEYDVRFPLPDKPLNVDEMDILASRLSQNRDAFYPLVGRAVTGLQFQEGQELTWTRGIVLAAVQDYDWEDSEDEEEGLRLARDLAQVEERYLPCCYAQEVLCEDGLYLLPPMHRFGWWCVRAFEALDAGDAVGYTRCLRQGLDTCNTMKPMVEFLMKCTPELQKPSPSAEMLALAEQIRTVLAGFAPDDPAVAMLKQSEAYQKAAYLIEGLEPPVVGGQLQ